MDSDGFSTEQNLISRDENSDELSIPVARCGFLLLLLLLPDRPLILRKLATRDSRRARVLLLLREFEFREFLGNIAASAAIFV